MSDFYAQRLDPRAWRPDLEKGSRNRLVAGEQELQRQQFQRGLKFGWGRRRGDARRIELRWCGELASAPPLAGGVVVDGGSGWVQESPLPSPREAMRRGTLRTFSQVLYLLVAIFVRS